MLPFDTSSDSIRVSVRVWVDALTYALAVTAVAGSSAVFLGVGTGGGLVRAKQLLFVGGWLLLAYTTVRLWPTSPKDVASDSPDDMGRSIAKPAQSSRFQKFVRTLPPRRWVQRPPPAKQLSSSGKLFLSSVAVLVLSYLFETVFGIY